MLNDYALRLKLRLETAIFVLLAPVYRPESVIDQLFLPVIERYQLCLVY